MIEDLDAIVVGGGLAGVTAARDLAHSGARTVLIEARDRLGGRTDTGRLAGVEVDTGGAYFHWFQSAIWREVSRYELPVVESALTMVDEYLLGGPDGVTTMPGAEFDERLRRGFEAFWDGPDFRAAFPRPFAIKPNQMLDQLDAMSVEDRLQELGLDPTDDRVLRAILSDFGEPERTSLAWVLQRVANGIWNYETVNALFAIYRLERGMTSLVDAIVQDGGYEVVLSSPVTAIEQHGAGATVALRDGSTLSARVIVVATPIDVWKTISFTPALPPMHDAAMREGVALPAASNMLIHVRGVTQPFVMLSPLGDMPFDIAVTHTLLADGQLIQAFSITGAVTNASPREHVARAVREVLPEAELVDYTGHDWQTDPYSRGGWGTLRVGQLTRFLDVLDQPVGRLFFAGADFAPQFPGMLTGAIESGSRAGRRARLALEASTTA